MMQSGERSERGFEAAGTERAGTVFVSASAADARAFRQIVVGSRWLVVNVPDLIGAHAAIDKLRPRLVVCDTKIEGRGSWRDLLKGRDSGPSFALIVVSRHAGEALWAEVRNLGGFGVLEKPFVAEEVERIVALSLLGRSSPATACALGSQPLHNGNRTD
jgi:DNA-binding NtrC family response regulator